MLEQTATPTFGKRKEIDEMDAEPILCSLWAEAEKALAQERAKAAERQRQIEAEKSKQAVTAARARYAYD